MSKDEFEQLPALRCPETGITVGRYRPGDGLYFRQKWHGDWRIVRIPLDAVTAALATPIQN